MKRRCFLAVAAVTALCVCGLQAQPLHVLTTGDMHGWIEDQKVDDQVLGGSAEMLAYWKRVENYRPDHFLVLSAGDNATGPSLSTVFSGDPVIDVMNLMGYDATALGNHEFDFTVDHIREWEKTAKFPFLAANLVGKSGAPVGFVRPYVIINQDGVKVAVIGLITTSLPTLTNNAGPYSVLPYADTLRKVVPEVRALGAQTVIVDAHVPQDELVSLADAVKDLGIPLMIGGHSHEFAQRMVGNTWVVNSGEWWKGYTRVDLDYNAKSGKTIVLSSKAVWLQQEKAAEDGAVADVRDRWKGRMARDYGTPIGYTVSGLNRDALYNFVPMATLEYSAEADVAMTNFGSMRQDIAPGPITKSTIIGVMPFSNTLISVKITGETLIKFLPGNAYAGLKHDGDKFILTKTGKPIDPKGIYTVFMNDYMYSVSDLLKSADPTPTKVAPSWRDPVYHWFSRHATSKENPVEKAISRVDWVKQSTMQLLAANSATPGTTGIDGFTNSDSNVTWSDTVNGVPSAAGTLTPISGQFSFDVVQSPGLHQITATTKGSADDLPCRDDISLFFNSLEVNSFAANPGPSAFGEQGRFNPDRGDTLDIGISTQADDTLDVEVIDQFCVPEFVGLGHNQKPIRPSDLMNGSVESRSVKKVWTRHFVSKDQAATVHWDGTDSLGKLVAAGPYLVRINRSNTDGLLSWESRVAVVLDRGEVGTPIISDVQTNVQGLSIAVTWTTSTDAAGAVLYQEGSSPIAKVISKSQSRSHLVYLPRVRPGQVCTFWVTAKDLSGHTSISARHSVTAGPAEFVQDVYMSVSKDSNTEADVSWTPLGHGPNRIWEVQYARVDKSISELQWLTKKDASLTSTHSVHLTDLVANSEYVVRIVASDADTHANPSLSSWYTLTTETTEPSVSIISPTRAVTVTGLVSVKVQASDSASTRSPNGIARVELQALGQVLEPISVQGNIYTFQVDTSNADEGSHILIARAVDDFGNESDSGREMAVGVSPNRQ